MLHTHTCTCSYHKPFHSATANPRISAMYGHVAMNQTTNDGIAVTLADKNAILPNNRRSDKHLTQFLAYVLTYIYTTFLKTSC